MDPIFQARDFNTATPGIQWQWAIPTGLGASSAGLLPPYDAWRVVRGMTGAFTGSPNPAHKKTGSNVAGFFVLQVR
jgi:hypothetical protein